MSWFNKIDLNLLVSQKMTLLFVIDQIPLSKAQRNELQGIVHLLDSLQDVCESQAAPAVPQGEPVAWMLPRKGEDRAEFHEADEPFNDSFKTLGWTPLYAATSQPLTDEVFRPIVKAVFDAGWATCRASELVGDNAKEFAWDMYGDELTERLIAAIPPQEPVNRPQNCGTSFCSCIECVCEPEPVSLTDRQFDLICQAIDKADTITMEGDYMMDSGDCIAVVRVMQALFSIAAPSQERCCTCGYLTSEREHLGCLRKAVKDLDAATGGPYPSQPVTLTDEYAGVIAWVGDKQCKRVLTEGAIKHEHTPGVAMRNAAHQCVQEVIIDALREKG